MHRKYFYILLVLSLASAIFIAYSMWDNTQAPLEQKKIMLSQRAFSPFESYITGVGIVEASSDNIYIGSPVNRIVEKIDVAVGEKVQKGDVLFRLEDRDLKADLLTRRVAFQNAVAKLQKLESLPRSEDVATGEAALKIAQLELAQARDQYQSVEDLQGSGALSQEVINNRRFKFEQAEAKLKQAQADLEKINAGAWQPDLEIARLHVQQASTEIQRVQADINRTVIRAPIDATVLQIKIHEGEFPPSDSSRTPPMIIGNVDTLHLRVSINQFDAPYFSSEAKAVAFVRGNAKIEFPLKFIRLEPYFVPKQNLTNSITEKIDTRVLQIIYCFEENDQRIYVGQQMDVFIETPFSPLD